MIPSFGAKDSFSAHVLGERRRTPCSQALGLSASCPKHGEVADCQWPIPGSRVLLSASIEEIYKVYNIAQCPERDAGDHSSMCCGPHAWCICCIWSIWCNSKTFSSMRLKEALLTIECRECCVKIIFDFYSKSYTCQLFS